MRDFILQKINKRIELSRVTGPSGAIGVYYRSRIEYLLTLMLGYLWNKNFEKLEEDDKVSIFGDILNPTIGTILQVCRSLDVDKEIFSVRAVAKSIDKYPDMRNKLLGHGFVYEDALEDSEEQFLNLYDSIMAVPDTFFSKHKDFIHVQLKLGNIYKGVLYSSMGEIRPWSMPISKCELKEGNFYISIKDSLYNVSPFVRIDDSGDSIYIYCKTIEKLTGRLHYNQLMNTGTKEFEWAPFANLCVLNDGMKIKTANGTIRNIYDNNYTTFIEVAEVHNQLLNFLKTSKSSVCATLWGHGGIGKTATIQNVCEVLSNKEHKTFDYIVFISAKDRRYDYYKGIIERVDTSISTYEDVIRYLNTILFEENNNNENKIVQHDGTILLVLDDFESFAKEEAQKLSDFITRLDINHHKVVVTTRSANVSLGLEIKTNELDVQQTTNFIKTLIKNEGILLSMTDENRLEDSAIQRRIHEITSGRPLFIYQLGHIIGQKGLTSSLNYDIKKGESAVEFLYGRIYEYLSPMAKDLFVSIGLLVTKDDLTNVLDKAQYIINMENDDDGFNSVVEELVKLKIIKVTDEENRYFEVYSREVLEMMNKHFSQRDSSFVSKCNARRAKINKDKNADIEQSLLTNANANRLVKSEIETVESYKQILNRPSSSLDIKMNAVFNLANYLLVDRGKRKEALEIFDKYSHFYTGINSDNSSRSLYSIYAYRWATTYWANGTESEKQKAINILSDYFKGKVNYHNERDLEVASTLLMYKSIMIIREWRELRDKYKFNDVSFAEYRLKRGEQIKKCQGLLNYIGNPLYLSVAQKKLTEFPSGTRQSLITAFFNYVDVLVRINKKDLAVEICDYVTTTGPLNFKSMFGSKKAWILSLK